MPGIVCPATEGIGEVRPRTRRMLKENEIIDYIRQYRELLDQAVLNDYDYKRKKTQLLQLNEDYTVVSLTENEIIDYLKQYKELLDSEALTLEEFIKKKNQLLYGSVSSSFLEAITEGHRQTVLEEFPDNEAEGSPVLEGFAARPDRIGLERLGAKSPIPTEDPEHVICPRCGTRQRSNRSICHTCALPFLTVED